METWSINYLYKNRESLETRGIIIDDANGVDAGGIEWLLGTKIRKNVAARIRTAPIFGVDKIFLVEGIIA